MIAKRDIGLIVGGLCAGVLLTIGSIGYDRDLPIETKCQDVAVEQVPIEAYVTIDCDTLYKDCFRIPEDSVLYPQACKDLPRW